MSKLILDVDSTNLEILSKKRLQHLLIFISRHDLKFYNQSIELSSTEIKDLLSSHPENYIFEGGTIIIQKGLVIGRGHTDQVIIPQRYIFDDDYKAIFSGIVSVTIEQFLVTLSDKLGIYWMVSKTADELTQRYAISYGQSKAIVKKVLLLKLRSTDRSHLNELKKKIGMYKKKILKYQEVIIHFNNYISYPKSEIYDDEFFESSQDQKDKASPINSILYRDVASIIDDEFKEELQTKANKIVPTKVKIDSREKTIERYNKIIDQRKHEFLDVIKNLSPIEITDKPKDSSVAFFQCRVCEFNYLVPEEELKVNKHQTMPKHCNQFMKIRIEKKNKG